MLLYTFVDDFQACVLSNILTDYFTWDLSSPGAISTFTHVSGEHKPSPAYSYHFTLPHPGPVKDRQNASHPHQVIVDPTGRFLLSPDLGADLVRVFILEYGGVLISCNNISVSPGSGPRHGVFSTSHPQFYLVHELQTTVTRFSYNFSQEIDCLDFFKTGEEANFGAKPVPNGTLPAEVQMEASDFYLSIINQSTCLTILQGGSLVVSNRFDSSFPSITSNVNARSDSLSTFTLNPFQLQNLSSAGGSNPRHFSIDPTGSYVAVALQDDSKVVIIERNSTTGSLGNLLAEVDLEGQVTCVIWDEPLPNPH